MLNGRAKDGWRGPFDWKGEKISQVDGGFFCFVFFSISKNQNVHSSFNLSQHQLVLASTCRPPLSVRETQAAVREEEKARRLPVREELMQLPAGFICHVIIYLRAGKAGFLF